MGRCDAENITIYIDYAAATCKKEAVEDTILCLTKNFGNYLRFMIWGKSQKMQSKMQ
jgi:hypothetical protein